MKRQLHLPYVAVDGIELTMAELFGLRIIRSTIPGSAAIMPRVTRSLKRKELIAGSFHFYLTKKGKAVVVEAEEAIRKEDFKAIYECQIPT